MKTTAAPIIQIRSAHFGDNAKIAELFRVCSFGTQIQLTLERSPSFFQSLCVEGEKIETIVAEHSASGRIAACGVRAEKQAFLNGALQTTGYLGLCRIHPEYQHRRVLASGFRFLKKLHLQGRAHVYLTTISEDNSEALKILTSERAGLPRYQPWGELISSIIKPSNFIRLKDDTHLTLRKASKADLPELLSFLNAQGREKQFFPCYRENDFVAGGLLSGLTIENIFLAFDGKQIVGSLAVWDQRSYKQMMVRGYSPRLNLLRKAYNLIAPVLRRPSLPAIGQPIPIVAGALSCVERNEPSIFQALLREALRKLHQYNPKNLFLLSLHKSDPLLKVLQPLPHWKYGSHLYLAHWADGSEIVKSLDSRIPYVETGAL